MSEAMTLDEAKLYLRVDTDDDDTLINGLITAAESYVKEMTGKSQVITGSDADGSPMFSDISTDELWKLANKFLVSHWYENRDDSNPGKDYKVSHSIDALIHHIALCGDYV